MKNWLDYFKEICCIPREAGNEDGIRAYLLSFAKENGFEGIRDKDGNIIIKAPATKGCENKETVILQGHMDMVCVKRPGSKHDFTKDPIEMCINGDVITAKDTSLGGDNGIAMAMAMAILTDPEAQHGPVEVLITYSEETGLYGALNLDASLLNGRKLLNLDSEEENIITIGCAGGLNLFFDKKISRTAIPAGYKTIEVSISGLPGGHSGSEIHLDRPNAIKVLAEKISSLKDFMLIKFEGGTRDNVIPSSASAVLAVPADTEPDFDYTELQTDTKAVDAESSKEIIDCLKNAYHGVHTWSKAVVGVVETSNNLAIALLKDDSMFVNVNIRSLVESEKMETALKIEDYFKNFGFTFTTNGGYPGWQPNPDSVFTKQCCSAWKTVSGQDAIVTSVHAGLECGIIADKIPGLDCVSMGPNLHDVHSVNENLSISSTDKVFKFIKVLLKEI